MSSPLQQAVGILIDPTRVRVYRDGDERGIWQDIPSLWDQLTAAGLSGSANNAGAGAGGRSLRSVIATGIVALRMEVTAATTETAVELVGRTRGTVPANLRAIAATLTDPDQVEWWVGTVQRWSGEARQRLRLGRDRSQGVRGADCPRCGASVVHRPQDGEVVRQPALGLLWEEPDDADYHSDEDWRVTAVECRACGAVWFRGAAMHSLMIMMLEANVSRETMTG